MSWLDVRCGGACLVCPQLLRQWLTDTVLPAAATCIPLTTLRARKSSHPLLNDRAVALMDAKRAAQGTPLEMETTLACSAGLPAKYHDYIVRTAQKMRELKPIVQAVVEEGEMTRLRESAGSHGQVRMSTQSVTSIWTSKDALFSRQRSNAGRLLRTSVAKAPLVPTWCLHASSKAARSSWPNRDRSCCNVCWRANGTNTGLSPPTRRKPFLQPVTREVST